MRNVRVFIVRAVVCLTVVLPSGSHLYAQALPTPWIHTDIGAPPAAGSAGESSGTFSVRGAGTDIWYSSDQFHFVYQQITGDADIRAQVAGVEYIHEWTKAGVMIRASLDARAPHASTFVTPAKGLVFQRRVFAGTASSSTTGGSATAPYWVRVVRSGELFTSYISTDGSSWMLVGSETISMPATVYLGLAVVSKDPDRTALATFTDVTVGASSDAEPPPPPPPPPPPAAGAWTNGDIGGPVLPGRASESAGTFSVTGAGTDIWNGSDQFHFMYQLVEGDVEIVAHVVDVEYAHAWSKAGVMIREALTPSAAHALMAGTPGHGWAFQRRPVSGGLTVHTPGTFTAPPGWVRLVRSGTNFSAYESIDGTNWTVVGTETIEMPAAVYVGLAVTSHNASMTSTATFTNVAITGATSTNQPPSITLTAPASGTTYTVPATVRLTATASDSDGTVAKVEFFANGQSVGTDTQNPYEATWSNVGEGTHNLTAVATDNSGATTTSATATVTVNTAPNSPPTASITSPAAGANYTAPATITVNANASDTDGTVTRVDFYRGTELIGSDTSSPYSVTWGNAPAGAYSLTAVAVDDDNASTTSATVNVTVTAAANQPPTVSITNPANGATFAAPATISISATAADSDGTVVSVQFLANGQSIGTVTTSPYGTTWTNVAAGTYSVTAVARDNANAATTSAAVTITVAGMPAPWTAGDVGSPALSGSASFGNGAFTVTGAGVDIWDRSDEFHYVYQPRQGDVEVIARVDSLEGPDPYTKSGVMIRETLAADSRNVFAGATLSSGWTFQHRRAAGDVTMSNAPKPAGTAPGWVRVVRRGDDFSAYFSPDGVTWTLLGSDTISMAPTVYVGLAITSHNTATRATGTLSNVSVSVPTPVPNQPPSVSITAPANGGTFVAPATITINATAADSDGTVASVRFSANGQPIGTDSSSPFSIVWNSVPVGTYSVTAVATDDDGAETTSSAVTITVGSTPPPPTATSVAFTPSEDHDTLVTSYTVAIYRDGDPATGTPIATKDLGKPAPTNGDITVDISDIINPLPSGTYYAVVSALGSGGSSPSTPSGTFNR